MAFPSLFEEFDKFLIKEFTKPRTIEKQTLTSSTIRTVKQKEEDRIKQEFEDYERRHFVVDNSVLISMLGCVEAYKSKSSRKQFLDSNTSYQQSVSTDRIAVYLKGLYSVKELFICIHGTRLTSIEDIIQDIRVIENSVASSGTTLEYLMDIITIRNQFPSIPNDNIYISGHSLGAIYSIMGCYMLNTNGYGFNGASALLDLQFFTSGFSVANRTYDLGNIQNNPKFTSYRISGDPISLLSKWTLRNVVNINVVGVSDLTPLEKHSMNTFLKFCIPLVPLRETAVRARRSGKLDDSRDRDNINPDGENEYVQQVEPSTFDILKYLNPFD